MEKLLFVRPQRPSCSLQISAQARDSLKASRGNSAPVLVRWRPPKRRGSDVSVEFDHRKEYSAYDAAQKAAKLVANDFGSKCPRKSHLTNSSVTGSICASISASDSHLPIEDRQVGRR